MSAHRSHSSDAYREWHHASVTVSGTPYQLATKQGVFSHRTVDPSAHLLADTVNVREGDVVVHFNGGGVFGSVAATAHRAERVLITHRNVLGVEAALRTLLANDVENAEVLLGHGSSPLPAGLQANVVAIRIPQERLATLQLLWDAFRALKVGGRCYIAGATNEGIKTAARTMATLFGGSGVLAQSSGHRLVVANKRDETPASIADLTSPYLDHDTFNELDAQLCGRNYRLCSRPGVFSWDHVDEATEILAGAMQIGAGESVLDIGCGYGPLGTVAGTLSGDGPVCMVDADVEAVRSAIRTSAAARLTRVRVLTSDVAAAVLDERFDVVVTNPPFHVGKATDLEVPMQFINDAWTVLKPGGRVFLVANRTLPYEQAIRALFGNIETVHNGPRFKVVSARRG